MKKLNTLPIEDFFDKARIAIKTNQKTVTFSLKEVIDLQNSLSVVMTRLTGELDQAILNQTEQKITVKLDGGRF